MSNDYLWDPNATPDPEVQRLEQMLGRLRSTPPAPALTDAVRPKRNATYPESAVSGFSRTSWKATRFLAPMLAAAAIVLMVASTWRSTAPAPVIGNIASWEVAALAGQPRIGSIAIGDTGRIAVGQTLTTDATSRALINVGTIGAVAVETNTRVRLVATREGHHQLALDLGTVHATIVAPPGQFVVDTPSSRATDLGCAYMLHVDEDGRGLLSVTAGWVAFEFRGRESFVPAGASSRTDPQHGPGTPRYDITDEAFQRAIDEFDGDRDAARKAAALRYVLNHASVHDAMTLWHLIPRVSPADRGAVVDALAARAPMPATVTRDAVMRLEKAGLDQWWDSLGLGEATWWRMWKGRIGSLYAVGIKETARITVSGPGIPQSVEITEPRVLALSSVYAGTFIGTPATAPDAAWPRYTVTFDVQTAEGVKVMAYVVYYVRDHRTGDGFIYLPGRGDEGYRRNIGTILRSGQDGKWHHAARDWSHAIATTLP